MVGRLHFKGTKIGNYRVDYNSTRSAAPKLGRGGARCRGRWIAKYIITLGASFAEGNVIVGTMFVSFMMPNMASKNDAVYGIS